MKTYIHPPLKQGRTFDVGRRGKQQPPLPMLLRTYHSFDGNFPTQLARKECKVSGITHIVQLDGEGSLMNGKKICAVTAGDKVWINDSVRMRSRRGPNIEVYETVDQRGEPIYKWYSVEKLNGNDLPAGCFIREDTLDAKDIEIEGVAEKRTRIRPEQVPEHKDAARIIQNAKRLVLDNFDETNLSERELVSLFTLKIAYALGIDAGMRQELVYGRAEEVMKVVRILEQVCGKQLLQDWGENKENDLERRTDGWSVLQTLITAFSDVGLKREKLRVCLDHDKGYAQIFTYLQDALLPQEDGPPLSFKEIVEEALKEERNINIFRGGMRSATIRDQIIKEGDLYEIPTRLASELEKDMWVSIATAVINVKSRGQAGNDWHYYSVMRENIEILFEIVQSTTDRLVFDKSLLEEFLDDPF